MGEKNTPEYQAISFYRAKLERHLSPHLSTISEKLRDIKLLTSDECDSIKADGSSALVKKILFIVEDDPVEMFLKFIRELNSIAEESEPLKKFIDKIETKKKEGYINLLSATSAASGRSYDVFISYGREQQTYPTVDLLSTLLTNEGLKVFVDTASLQPGDQWPAEIADAVCTSKAFVAILTKKYMKSRYCHGELYKAEVIGNKLFFPVVLETGWDQESAGMPINEILESFQHTMCNGDKEDHDRELRKLAKSIKDKIKPSEEKVKTPVKSPPRKRFRELEGPSASANQGAVKKAKKIDPYTESLKPANIDTIVTRLHKVRVEWFSLGMALRVDHITLKDIEKQHRDSARCLQEMITHRLQSGTDLEPLTWKKICDSLRKSTVGRNDVAKEIETALDLQHET